MHYQDYTALQPLVVEDSTLSHKHNRKPLDSTDANEPKVPGAVLLQAILHLPEPGNAPVVKRLYILLVTIKSCSTLGYSIASLTIIDCITMAHHPVSSRVLDALLESSTVSFKHKRAFVLSLLGHFHELVDDRIGSRVGDRCWAWADTYLKVSLISPHAGYISYYS